MKKRWCSRNAQICYKIDTLEGSFEMASTTALFYLKKGISLYKIRAFPKYSKGVVERIFQTLVTLFFFILDGTSTLDITGGY